MRSHPPRYFSLMNPLTQQIHRVQSSLLQLVEIPPHARRIAHDETIARKTYYVTILFNIQYRRQQT